VYWIKSPAWDLVWVLNALWLSPLVLLLARGYDDVRAGPVDGLFFVLAVPLWFGHRVSSAWLAYLTPAYRPLLATQRLRFVVAPIAILVACFALLLAPESVLPMPFGERVVWFAILNYVLVSHHFAAQHFGLLSLYRARAGRAADRRTRRLDQCFALVVGGGFVVMADALTGSVALLAHDPFLFIVVWSVQHWSAAMGLSSLAAGGGARAPDPHWQRLLAPINRRAWAVLLVLAVVSALLLPLMEVEAVTDEYAYADRLFGETARWLRHSPYVPALLALGFATGFIHYLLDRAAFRFSSPDVRQAARALLQA